jgi:hypothetical protein
MKYNKIKEIYALVDEDNAIIAEMKEIIGCFVHHNDEVGYMLIKHGSLENVSNYKKEKVDIYKKALNLDLKSINLSDNFTLEEINRFIDTTGYFDKIMTEKLNTITI